MRKRTLGIGLFGTLFAAGGFLACSSDDGIAVDVTGTSNPAVVSIQMLDPSGTRIGTCTGTLISSSAVLTAGHCVAGAGSWVVTASNAHMQTANGVLGYTTWEAFHSNWSHPYHSDVGVIVLDRQIFVESYPTVANTLAPEGTTLARMRRVDATEATAPAFSAVVEPVFAGAERGFSLNYWTLPAPTEQATDTGGGLIDPQTNTLYGVVSGLGTTSHNLFVARVDYLEEWIRSISECSPPPATTQCHPNDDGGSSSSGGSGSSSGDNGSSSGNSSGGSSGWNGSSSGSGGSSNGGSSNGGSSGGDDGGTCNPPPPPPPPPPPADSGCGSSGGSSGGTSSGSSSGHSGSSGSGSGSSGGTVDAGMPDSGIVLIPDGPGCVEANCGGCGGDPNCGDVVIDYGDCGCNPPPPAAPEGGPIF
jgi:uncharacterized membrane protein YgcG